MEKETQFQQFESVESSTTKKSIRWYVKLLFLLVCGFLLYLVLKFAWKSEVVETIKESKAEQPAFAKHNTLASDKLQSKQDDTPANNSETLEVKLKTLNEMAKIFFEAEELLKCTELFESMSLDTKKMLAEIARKQLELEQDEKIGHILKRFLDKWNPQHLTILASSLIDTGKKLSKSALWFIENCEKELVTELEKSDSLESFKAKLFLLEEMVRFAPRVIIESNQHHLFNFLASDQHQNFVDKNVLRTLFLKSILNYKVSRSDAQKISNVLVRFGKSPEMWEMTLFRSVCKIAIELTMWEDGYRIWMALRTQYLRESTMVGLNIGITINEIIPVLYTQEQRQVCFNDMKYISGPIVHEDMEKLYESYSIWFAKNNFKVIIDSDTFKGYQNSVNSVDPQVRKIYLRILQEIGVNEFPTKKYT